MDGEGRRWGRERVEGRERSLRHQTDFCERLSHRLWCQDCRCLPAEGSWTLLALPTRLFRWLSIQTSVSQSCNKKKKKKMIKGGKRWWLEGWEDGEQEEKSNLILPRLRMIDCLGHLKVDELPRCHLATPCSWVISGSTLGTLECSMFKPTAVVVPTYSSSY